MELYITGRSDSRYGGLSPSNLLTDHLLSGLPDFGGAIREIDITLHFGGPFDPATHFSLEGLWRQHNENMLKLPKRRFIRERERITIEFASKSLDRGFVDWFGSRTTFERHIETGATHETLAGALTVLEAFEAILGEVIDELRAFAPKIKKSDDFRFDALIGWFEEKRAALPRNWTDYKALDATLAAERLARKAAMDPWERLGLDFRDFHPDARLILDDPFFWEQADEFAPHGNDAGADLFAAFQRWRKRRPNASSESFFRYQKMSLCIDGDPDDLEDMRQEYTDACIGMAFAHLKVDGACPDWARRLGLDVIAQARQIVAASEAPWEHRDEQLARLSLLARTLEAAPKLAD